MKKITILPPILSQLLIMQMQFAAIMNADLCCCIERVLLTNCFLDPFIRLPKGGTCAVIRKI